MKIFLPFHPKSIGGTSTFALKFKDIMYDFGHEVSFEPTTDYDLLFLIVQAPFKYLQDAKKRRKKIVQRLDGVYYWSIAKAWFPLYNAKSALIRALYSDHCIYQSEYCRASCNLFLGPSSKPSSIIINGVDLNIFKPEGTKINLRKKTKELVIFNASDFRYRHQIDPILEAVEIYRNKIDRNARLVLAGSFSREIESYPNGVLQQSWINYLGPIKNKDLPLYERSSDMFIFTHTNPPCPNNIIEAMACGLPICGLADGSMPELCVDEVNSTLLKVDGSGYWSTNRVNPDRLAQNIAKISKKLQDYSRESRRIAKQKFSLHEMGHSYEVIFTKILNDKLI
jgi:glycosyltransferase involved in cell wall biosynthesis